MKIAFAGTPLFAQAHLAALLNTQHEIVVVYTQPDRPAGRGQQLQMSPVKTLALEHHLPVEQPLNLKSPDAVTTLKNTQPDLLIVIAYGLILPQAILDVPRYGCINVHASLLPKWRGAAPIQRAILAGDNETGITLMQMDAGLDTGDIILQSSISISNDDTSATLHDKLMHLGAVFLVDNLEKLIDAPRLPQPKQASYAEKIKKEEAKIDWHQDSISIERQIRAFNPWPVAFTGIDGQLLRIWQAKALALNSPKTPGTIVAHHEQGIVVATKRGCLLLQIGQLPGKKSLPLTEILHARQTLFAVDQQLG